MVFLALLDVVLISIISLKNYCSRLDCEALGLAPVYSFSNWRVIGGTGGFLCGELLELESALRFPFKEK